MGGRNLIVCIDGTANQFGDKNTNVIEIYNLIRKDTKDNQQTWYNSGIGTYARPQWWSSGYLKQVVVHTIDLAIAWNFDATIQAAYRWLADNYRDGDCIFLFGFSRGAFQVRTLSAMVEKVGLIYKGNEMQIPFAYELYVDSASDSEGVEPATSVGSKQKTSKAERFKRAFSRNVKIHFVGAWDTVSSIGFARGKQVLPGTTEGMTHVCYFRHALALDERRVKFLPEYAWGDSTLPRTDPDPSKESHRVHPHTLEVWFPGTHSDIGGGNEYNEEMDRSAPPLRWMVLEATAAGLRTKPFQRELHPSEQIKVQESLEGFWWNLFEILPFQRLTFVTHKGGQRLTWKPHRGAGRQIQPGQKIHSSFILGEPKTNYIPKAIPPGDNATFWEDLREDIENERGWLEVDIRHYARSLVNRVAAQNVSEVGRLRTIVKSRTGAQTVYDEVIHILEKRGQLASNAKCRLLQDAMMLLSEKSHGLRLAKLIHIRLLLVDLLSHDQKDYRDVAEAFIRQLTDHMGYGGVVGSVGLGSFLRARWC
ncbi:hypothetical protein H1R20_g12336, partial [Candolleomyces eurysporus]